MGEIGFLGLGVMGKAIAMNLLGRGFKLVVWNRTLSRAEELVEHGATVAKTPAEVIKKCKFTMAMLSDPAASLSVVFDQGGVLEQICSGKGYMDMSTLDANTTIKISEAIAAKGGAFLEGPVSGTRKHSESGQLIIIAAGDKSLYEEVLPIIDLMSKKSFFLGKVGNGAKMKLSLQVIMGSMFNSLAEGLVLAEKSGLDPQTFLDILDIGALGNPLFRRKGPPMIQGDYSPVFSMNLQQKDMRLALSLADELLVPVPVAAASNEVLEKGISMGLGDLDTCAVHLVAKAGKGSF
ncbi:glyoxylate/succinic semialdehyde reductase 1-like [Andrographis paniculata]|uniref:glyoxylate/succinic semialdehyde reductase 1-like n=1 Tax=Andrographis paniculata TaxID=175694 RepID=UPI0021E95B25|nr:glyoxylate/succinic semialdehyde reductase 1-like [Andrographis paniculata]